MDHEVGMTLAQIGVLTVLAGIERELETTP
jgi:hypothetical protein